MKKYYYKIEFCLLEPLSIGSGDNRYSDRDLLRDSFNRPFIPGSSLCGVYRSMMDSKTAEQYFGTIKMKKEEQIAEESQIKVYDAVLKDGTCTTMIRDSVGLDEYKTAKEGAKFDLELAAPGAVFVTYLEQDSTQEEDLDIGAWIAKQYQNGNVIFGHKSMRGFGRVKSTGIWRKTFRLDREDDLENWLEFDMYASDAFGAEDVFDMQDLASGQKENQETGQIKIELQLCQKSGISIRKYTTELTENGKNQPDYTQMYYLVSNSAGTKEVPFIPGSSWAGAFRHHMKQLFPAGNEVIPTYFGKAENGTITKSKVRFSESILEGAKLQPKVITRTAIDRFTSGTVDGALYTEKTFFDGITSLTISFPDCTGDEKLDHLWKQMIAASIADLHIGILAVGGLTAVGRGIFSLEKGICNGKEFFLKKSSGSDEFVEAGEIYKTLLEMMEECRLKERGNL